MTPQLIGWLMMAAALTGCAQNVYPKDLKKMEQLCKDNGGWSEIDPRWPMTVRCHDDGRHRVVR